MDWDGAIQWGKEVARFSQVRPRVSCCHWRGLGWVGEGEGEGDRVEFGGGGRGLDGRRR